MNAAKAVNQYAPALVARATSDPLLKLPANSPQIIEQQAVRMAQIKGEVADETGVSSIPAYTRMRYASQLASVEGQVKGSLYKARQSAQADLNFDALSSALALSLARHTRFQKMQHLQILRGLTGRLSKPRWP